MDKIDARILDMLVSNSRIAFREIARQVGLSAPATVERIAKMQDIGLITGFTVSLDRVAMGLPIQAFLRTATGVGEGPRLLDVIERSPEVEECHKVTGADSYLVKVSVSSMAALEELIERITAVGTVNTSMILSSPIPYRVPKMSQNGGHRPDKNGGRRIA